ncbi:MAG: type II toxin-antitoxin system RelE/ParE family toxin [Candidatus Latescibacteria bacterium]|nr:type II toxin-antitoxin system RelE/ParE family toxin [Candidatus Latescibacterota bacterium]
MEIAFRTNRLRRNYEASDGAVRDWGAEVGRKYITRINALYAVKNLQEVYSIRSMRLHPLKGSKRGELSISLTGKWRLIVTKGESEECITISEVSNHYDD